MFDTPAVHGFTLELMVPQSKRKASLIKKQTELQSGGLFLEEAVQIRGKAKWNHHQMTQLYQQQQKMVRVQLF